MKKPHLNQENAVIIRIWHSGLLGGEQVGHVSLEIVKHQCYISLWPDLDQPRSPAEAEPKFHTLVDDMRAEGRNPESTFFIFSLDVESILKIYQDVKQRLELWRLSSQAENSDSCATFAFKLLKHGGIETLAPSVIGSSLKLLTFSPDGLCTYLIQAVKQERELYPNTINFEKTCKKPTFKIETTSSLGDWNWSFKKAKKVTNEIPEKQSEKDFKSNFKITITSRSDVIVNVNQNNFVVARIWLAQVDGVETSVRDAVYQMGMNAESDVCIGHVTLQLFKMQDDGCYDTRYASYWPKADVQPDEVTEGVFRTVREDIYLEGRVPDRTYVLFSLDHTALWDAMNPENLKESFPYYTLIDGELARKKVQKKVSFWGSKSESKDEKEVTQGIPPKSCSGVVYDLVTGVGYEGTGLNHLKIRVDITRDLIVSSPNTMNDLFKEAEHGERMIWPETKQYKANVVNLLVNTLLSANDLNYYDDFYMAVKDLIQTSDRFIAATNHRKTLLDVFQQDINPGPIDDTSLQKPRIIIQPGRYGPLLPVLYYINQHPKRSMGAALCLVFLLGRYVDSFGGLLNMGVYLIAFIGAAMLLTQALNRPAGPLAHNENSKQREPDSDQNHEVSQGNEGENWISQFN